MTALTILTNAKGDFELHIGGCGDIGKASRRYPERVSSFEGTDLASVIVEVDSEAAAWFGQEPYTQDSRDNGCWAVANGINPSPCVAKAIKSAGIIFDADGRPVVK